MTLVQRGLKTAEDVRDKCTYKGVLGRLDVAGIQRYLGFRYSGPRTEENGGPHQVSQTFDDKNISFIIEGHITVCLSTRICELLRIQLICTDN